MVLLFLRFVTYLPILYWCFGVDFCFFFFNYYCTFSLVSLSLLKMPFLKTLTNMFFTTVYTELINTLRLLITFCHIDIDVQMKRDLRG